MALYARESRLFVPVGTDMALAIDALTVAGTNADALRHFNDNISSEMDLRPQLGRVEAPTLVITGELDPFGESTAREIADALPNATLIVLPDVDHFPFMEPGNRASWSRAVLDFLTG